MKITDLNGYTLEVTDLEAAIKQADEFRKYEAEDDQYKAFSLNQQAYWQDIYEKLLGLRPRRKRGT